MIRVLAVLALAPLAACGGLPVPIVDMTGVHPARHNRDQAECQAEVSQRLVSAGDATATCMERRGYRVLRRG